MSAPTTVPALTLAGTIPLFLLLPGHEANDQRESVEGMANVFVCAWELAFASGDDSLQRVIGEALSEVDLEGMLNEEDGGLEQRVKDRLERLDTLPTLPAIIMHIMRVVSDPRATVAQLEELLMRDTAIVLKVMQVANSPYFMGTARSGQRWTLQEAVVRLGVKKVGAIAQQIALINTFVRPDDNDFDIERFWAHSVAVAMIADRLVEDSTAGLEEKVPFNDYWMAALLHDCGKVVQGFFFHDWFERILRTMDSKTSFAKAEADLGGAISHEWIGELLLRRSDMPNDLMRAVGLHHVLGERPSPLASLVHAADGIAKEMGMGLVEDEAVEYNRAALSVLQLKRDDVRKLSKSYASLVKGEVRRLVKECMS
ncbi:MAG: HDOD domain-containing protein [Candidatus Latescibacteria bacterium]|nr:HDOD domain-containing protein [Candidatus Latescibacterota bacterium]